MIAGSKYYVTFDGAYYTFQGQCSYLLTTDTVDRNFSLAISYNGDQLKSYVIVVIVGDTVVHIDMSNKVRTCLMHAFRNCMVCLCC